MAKKSSVKKTRKDVKKRKGDELGLLVPAGFFIGFGLGLLLDNVPAGMFGGLGLGLLMFASVTLMSNK